uniref:Variant surface glycoprotein n=1 Tax=Trypanosoma brucei TaxID=5691 RepID=A0A1V0FXV7_9TRYP|nr:variant surface glycoprotein [Trypanosoma brucei]
MLRLHSPAASAAFLTTWSTLVALTAALLVLQAARVAQAAAKGGLKHAEWTAACGLADTMKKVQQKAAKNIADEAAAASRYLQQYYRTAIYIEKTKGGEYSALANGVLAYYAKMANDIVLDLQTVKTQTMTTSIRDASRLEATVAEFITNLGEYAGAASFSCLEASAVDASFRAVSPAVKTQQPGCDLSTTPLQLTETALTGFSGGSYTGTLAATGATESITGGAGLECELTAAKANTHILDQDQATATIQGTPRFGGGLYYLAAGGLQRTQLTNLGNDNPDAPLIKAAYQAYEAAATQPISYRFKKGSELAKDAIFVDIYRKTISQSTKAGVPSDNELAETIKSAFGGDDEMAKEYDQNFATTKVPNIVNKQSPEKTLNTVDDLAELAALLGHYRQRNMQALVAKVSQLQKQAKENPPKPSETDATCEKKGKEDNCKEGCKWDSDGGNKKCVVDQNYKPPQTEGGEKDSKTGTTNTTGSNSFVINKAPLLLAVLLF